MKKEIGLLHKIWEYPLFEALFGRRSRRFGLGSVSAKIQVLNPFICLVWVLVV